MSQTVCFFGATGGVTNACLSTLLTTGTEKAIALVRNPQKLRDQLILKQGIKESVVDKRLAIVKGNAVELADVKRALLTHVAAGTDTSLPSMIVTGLGGVPSLTFSIWQPLTYIKLDNPTICESSTKILITALQQLRTEKPELAANKPSVVYVSTTGVSRGVDDVPWYMRFLYHQLLYNPHMDKRNMEDVFRNHQLKHNPVFASVSGIRPTLLTGEGLLSEGKAVDAVNAGVESAPAYGFTIQRTDVGSWMYHKLISGGEKSTWRGEMISLAYH